MGNAVLRQYGKPCLMGIPTLLLHHAATVAHHSSELHDIRDSTRLGAMCSKLQPRSPSTLMHRAGCVVTQSALASASLALSLTDSKQRHSKL